MPLIDHYFKIYLLYDSVSQLSLIGQLEGNISPYCPLVIARSLLPVPIVTRKSYNKSIIAIPQIGQYGEIFRS